MHWTSPRATPVDRQAGDPYFAWARATQWRGFRRLIGERLGSGDNQPPPIRILVQAAEHESAQQAIDHYESVGVWRVAEVYKNKPLRHFVAELACPEAHGPEDFDAVLNGLESLQSQGLQWELALPFRDADTAARAQAVGAYGETRQASAFSPKSAFVPQDLSDERVRLSGLVMAVVDFGFPFLNLTFRAPRRGEDQDTPASRVHALWDQGGACAPRPYVNHLPSGWPWSDASPRMGYGRELRQAAIQDVLTQYCSLSRSGHLPDEAEAYRMINYLIDYDDPRRRVWAATHGSHVTSVAAGQTDPLRPDSTEVDAAGQAPLVLVQLPALTAADSGGGSLSAQVLDAVHYVLDQCKPEAKIVLTLSYGSLAGPHDGSTLIEQALDELIEHFEQGGGTLALVLGAGNSRQAACHVRRTVRKDRSALLRVGLAEGDYTDTYVETWFQSRDHLSSVEARARTCDGDWSPWVAPGEEAVLTEGRSGGAQAGPTIARLSFQEHVPNGSKPLLLLAMAPTARPADDDGPLARPGSWQIEIKLDADASVTLDAWVERDDPGWLGYGVQPRFEEQRWGDDEETLSSLASGRCTIVAGGFRLSNRQRADYSAMGARQGAPVVYAACEESDILPTVRGAATRSGDSLRICGTSVAAPVLARCIYNWMSANPGEPITAADWRGTLKVIVEDEQTKAIEHDRPAKLRLGTEP
ncbi:S8 family serine peptidase [Ideonella sp. 4Y11]|uniref:S8 family serine peptidase n=1 Tax=Ideonella aquatica TaxID=2824119 RepID=A0A940YQT3_9BURK|nr:S8 family serine peptidase [Ideonella aquatica]MBQ0960293.1 S8 family serine peptidase [Ideonella aquatica]